MFGGTFDPVHIGHMVAAVNVRHALALDRVMLVVANEPWQKSSRAITPAEDRLAVLAASIAGIEGLEASRIEIDRGGISYTIDTITDLRSMYPSAELHLVVGEDVARGLSSWKRASELRRMVRLVVVSRSLQTAAPGLDPVSAPSAEGTPCGLPDSVKRRVRDSVPGTVRGSVPGSVPEGWSGVVVGIPNLDISSTEIRQRAAAGQVLDLLVPPGGIEQIQARRLYACS